MAYQALYRKLRPNKFSEVFGQDEIVKTLKNQVKNNQIAHAYLFCGTRGTGKTSLAKIMANAVNCLNPVDYEPCGSCAVCTALKSEGSVDVVELDAASRNGVDDMRELLERVAYPPQLGRYKVYIIDEVHMLSTSAFNALLKTLEEPPEYIIFILATTESQKIPATILSRCQRFDLNRIPSRLIFEKMIAALDQMQIPYEEAAVLEIAIAADGSVRDGWSILDICISGMEEGTALNAARVQNMLGTSNKQFILSMARAIVESDFAKLMSLSAQLMQEGKEPLVSLKQLAQLFRNLLLTKVCNDNVDERIGEEEYQALTDMAQKIEYKRILGIVDLFMEQEMKLKWASNPRIGFESALLRAASPIENCFDIMDAVEGLSSKIELLESREPTTIAVPSNAASAAEAAPVEKPPQKAKPLFAPEANERRIWKEAQKRIRGQMLAAISGAVLLREEGSYFICYPEGNKLSHDLLLHNKEYQQQISALIAELTGEDVSIGLRILKKDNTVTENMIKQTIQDLENSLPSGTLQVIQ